jgi:hypothetical protein
MAGDLADNLDRIDNFKKLENRTFSSSAFQDDERYIDALPTAP